jgi:lysozyme family protein
LYQSQIGSLDAHRKEHAADQDRQMEAMAHDLAALRTEQIGPIAAEVERIKTEQLATLVAKVDTIMDVQAAHQKREEEKKAEALRHQQEILAAQKQLSDQIAGMATTAATVGKIVVAPLVVAIIGSLVIGTNSSPHTRTLAVYAIGAALLLTVLYFVVRYLVLTQRKERLGRRGPYA